MSEEQIERAVEQKTNSLDARFMSGLLTQAEYDAESRKLSQWAEAEYRKAK